MFEMPILLNDDERARFATWLEEQAESSEAICKQLLSLGPHGEIIAQREKQEADASLLIAAKLRSIESASIDA